MFADKFGDNPSDDELKIIIYDRYYYNINTIGSNNYCKGMWAETVFVWAREEWKRSFFKL